MFQWNAKQLSSSAVQRFAHCSTVLTVPLSGPGTRVSPLKNPRMGSSYPVSALQRHGHGVVVVVVVVVVMVVVVAVVDVGGGGGLYVDVVVIVVVVVQRQHRVSVILL